MSYDMSQIHERLWVGANVNTPSDVADISAAGITHVIDANTDDERTLFDVPHEITLLANGTPDDGSVKGVEWFRPAIAFAVTCLATPGAKLLCHCAAGVNRGPSIGFAVLRMQGWSFLEALSLLHNKRPVTNNGIAYRYDAESALVRLGWIKRSEAA